MSANLAVNRYGKTAFVSLREAAWHRKGTTVDDGVSGREMLRIAGLDYNVASAEMYATISTESSVNEKPIGWDSVTDTPIMGRTYAESAKAIPDSKAVYRQDTGDIFGVVGSDYQIFQNREMVDLFDALVGAHDIQYETAGAIGNGSKVWILAHIPSLKFEVKGDMSIPYMLIATGHTGNSSLCVFPTTVRVVCSNTHRAAMADFERRKKGTPSEGYRIRHTSGMQKAVAEVARSYYRVLEDIKFTNDLYNFLAEQPATTELSNAYFKAIVGDDDTDSEQANARRATTIAQLREIQSGPTNATEATENTMYGLYNTVTEYVDHFRGSRGGKQFESAMFGSGMNIKTRALEVIAELAGV